MLSRKNFDFLEPLKRYLRHTGRFVYTIIAGYGHYNTQYFLVAPSPLKPNFIACPTPQILQFPFPPLPPPLSNKTERPLKGDLHGTTFPHAASLRQVYDMTLDHLHALTRLVRSCTRDSCCSHGVSLPHARKSYRMIRVHFYS